MELVRRRTGRGAELLFELLGKPCVGAQCEGRRARAVLRQHQRPVRRLVKTVGRDRRLGECSGPIVIAKCVGTSPGKLAGAPEHRVVLGPGPGQPIGGL
jgi:hypothetical protein